MGTTVIPPDFHAGITPAGMRAYLTARGWRVTPGQDSPKYQVWRSPQHADVLVPNRTGFRDYPQRVMDLIRAAADLENRSQVVVWEDLTAASENTGRG